MHGSIQLGTAIAGSALTTWGLIWGGSTAYESIRDNGLEATIDTVKEYVNERITCAPVPCCNMSRSAYTPIN